MMTEGSAMDKDTKSADIEKRLPKAKGSSEEVFNVSGFEGGHSESEAWEEPKPKPKMVQEDDENFYGGDHPSWPWKEA